MIPKAGDVVDLNPAFKAAVRAYKKAFAAPWMSDEQEFGEHSDGHLHVRAVALLGDDLNVYLADGGSYLITCDGKASPHVFAYLASWFDLDAQLFVPIAGAVAEPRNNDERAKCFWCGGATERKQGFTSFYDICPKCGR